VTQEMRHMKPFAENPNAGSQPREEV